ncbi:protein WVD2-like protein 7 isoform X3 [Cinnamomum micranthum f. kanehirae]|uniref:Protein WVD2-like protein 7 isoform X3 n=1 Tax=Cinnamomum micranthum f. kanehirae TaxID=337451 RepID=A0A443PHQ3_9MAGN|nr:protein WVD2-like protein 7 isoform X3 [Cinnamomum micranthum f. kanehirae]
MATDMDRPYREWSHEEMSGDSQDVPLCQVLDHGSISFGRFAVESLSWEKWSVFSHNRCQEEIEKFKAPGIVAQKKAYFEEYYKRIRELKTLQREQDGQDTAAALGSGDDGSVCCKGGEEHNAEADDTISVVTSHSLLSEETTADVSIEKEKSFSDGFQFQYLLKEPMIPVVDSSRTVSDVRIEEIKQPEIGCNNLWNECGTRKSECPVAIAECLELESATQATVSEETETITQSDSNIPQEKDQISDQVVLSTLKHKDCTSISKDTASSIRNSASLKNDSVYKEAVVTYAKNNVTADHRSKGNGVKSSQGFKHPPGKPAYRAESSVNSRKTTSSKDVPNNSSTSMSSNRHFMKTHSNTMVPLPIFLSKERQASGSNRTRGDVPGHSDSKASNRLARLPGHSKKMPHSQMAVSSDRPLKEVRSNITVPRPFTFSTEKRAAAPTSTRDSSQRHSVSKASNRLVQPTGHKKRSPYVQNTSVEIAVKGGMRGTSLATRRSINPHLKGHSNQQRGHEPSPRSSLTSNDMGKKQIEVKEEPEFRRFPQSLKFVGSQLPSFSKNGTPKSGHRKLQIIPSRCADQRGGPKSRQAMPCWR